jgi:hypothetical protein
MLTPADFHVARATLLLRYAYYFFCYAYRFCFYAYCYDYFFTISCMLSQ